MSEDATIVWQRSRWRTILSLGLLVAFGSLIFLVLVHLAPASSGFGQWYARLIGWFGILITSVIFVLATLELIWPTKLILRSEGFELTGLWRQSLIPWSQVTEFVVWRQTIRSVHGVSAGAMNHVGYRLTEEARARRKDWWRRRLGFGRYDGWLMSETGKRPQQVADILTARCRAAKHQLQLSPE